MGYSRARPPTTALISAPTSAVSGQTNPAAEIQGFDVTDPLNAIALVAQNAPGSVTMRDVEYHRGKVYAVANDNAGDDVFVYAVGGAAGDTLTPTGSVALNTNNTSVAFYSDTLLISTETPAKAVTAVDPTVVPPAVRNSVAYTTGAAALAVRDGVAHLATTGTASLQMVSPGLGLEPILPLEGTFIGCLGDSNTAQGFPSCVGQSCSNCPVPTCQPGGALASCEVSSVTPPEATVACPSGGTPTCTNPNFPTPFCSLSWCKRVELCLTADPLAPPTHCSVEGRVPAPRPDWTMQNTGAGFASIHPTGHPADGVDQMSAVLAAGVNAVVIALGTVDVGWHCQGAAAQVAVPGLGQIVDKLEDLNELANPPESEPGVQVFYTVPAPASEFSNFELACECEVDNDLYCFNRQMLRYRNRLFHEFPPERIIDFHTGMVRSPGPGSDYNLPGGDSLHVTASAHQKRARTALSKFAD